VALVASTCVACATRAIPSSPPLAIEGIWISDRDLTLVELQKAETWNERQWTFLSDPALFGHMVHVIRGHTTLVSFEGGCRAPEKFQVLENGASRVRIRFLEWDAYLGELEFQRVGDNLHIPIAMFETRPHEVFRRDARRGDP
jgi:hypothetical protein